MKNTLTTIALALSGLCLSPVSARVYHATPHIFTQPNGDSVSVRLFGTELYMDAESEDGYTLIRDDEDGYICYAMLSADGREYASSGIRYNGGQTPSEVTMIVKPHIRLNAERRNEIIADHESLFGHDKMNSPELRAATSLPDTVYGVCLMIDFPDRKFSISRDDVDIFLNSSDKTVYGNARSIKEHFRWMSGGKLTYINYLPKEIYHAPYNFNWYSPTDATDYTTDRFYPVITDALLAISKEKDGFNLNDISFSGPKIMAINIFYAGDAPEKWATGLWPHMAGYNFDLRSKYNISAKEWHAYQISNLGKDLSMGTFVHENGHLVLGLPDFYSYEESNKDNNIEAFNVANTFWTPDEKNPELLNPFSMDQLGWLSDKQNITNIKDGRKITLKQEVGNAAVYYGSGANANERYYLDVRDKHYENYYGQKNPGVMIWHVNLNGDNNYAGKPELLDGRPATSKNCMWNANNGPKVFSDDSDPSGKWYNGANSGIYLWDFSAGGSTMTFRCGNEINTPLSILTESIPEGELGVEYSVKIEGEGGQQGYMFMLKPGATLPGGLTLSRDGVISGIPTEGYNGKISIMMFDANKSYIEKDFLLKIKKIEIVGEYSFDIRVDVNDGYNATIVDINIADIAGLLGISPSDFVSKIGKDVLLYAVESNGNVVKSFTANNGYWYNLSGNVEKWSATTKTAAVYAEIDTEGNGMRIGQYPNNTNVGDSCTIKQSVIYGEAQINLVYNIKVVDKSDPTYIESPLASSDVDGILRVYNESGQFIGKAKSVSEIENGKFGNGIFVVSGFSIQVR